MLENKIVLIVESEILIALDLQRVLAEIGVAQVVFARSCAEALEAEVTTLGLAIIDAQPQNAEWITLVRRLETAGIPSVVMTAQASLRAGVPGYETIPVLPKPFMERDLMAVLARTTR